MWDYIDEFLEQREKDKTISVLLKIGRCEALNKEKNKLIDNIKYEQELIIKDMTNIIRNELSSTSYNLFPYYNSETFWKVWKYFNYKKEVKEKEKKEYKSIFEFITKEIKEKILLNNEDFKLVGIIDSSFSTKYSFEYVYKNDKKFSVYIPIFQRADNENYEDILRGYEIYYRESECYEKQIINDLNYKEVAIKFKKWLENFEARGEKDA